MTQQETTLNRLADIEAAILRLPEEIAKRVFDEKDRRDAEAINAVRAAREKKARRRD